MVPRGYVEDIVIARGKFCTNDPFGFKQLNEAKRTLREKNLVNLCPRVLRSEIGYHDNNKSTSVRGVYNILFLERYRSSQ